MEASSTEATPCISAAFIDPVTVLYEHFMLLCQNRMWNEIRKLLKLSDFTLQPHFLITALSFDAPTEIIENIASRAFFNLTPSKISRVSLFVTANTTFKLR